MAPFGSIPDTLDLRTERLANETKRPRPGHADLAGGIKYGHRDLRNVLERASARETAARTAAGALVRQFLGSFNVTFASHVRRIGDVAIADEPDLADLASFQARVETSEVRCADDAVSALMVEAIRLAKKERDSLGGVVEVIVRGLPVGLGSYVQWDRRLDARLAAALMSVPSVKGVEIGKAFESAQKRGSEVHDQIDYEPGDTRPRKKFVRRTNAAGGLEGGVTNGEDLIVRVAVKPISTLNRPLATVDIDTKEPAEAMVERADNCAVPVVGVIGEAVVALVLADAFLEKFGGDSMTETSRNYHAYVSDEY